MNVNSQAIAQNLDENGFVSLINLIKGKDETALSQLYDLTVNRVYGLALKILSNEADAEEVVCDVYSQLWHKAADFHYERGSVMTWLLVICRSRALDLLRKKHPEYFSSDDSHMNVGISNDELPDDIIGQLQEGTAIKNVMQQLTDVQRQLIALAYFKGLSHSEIAVVIQMPPGTVKSHIRRALQTMHNLIEL